MEEWESTGGRVGVALGSSTIRREGGEGWGGALIGDQSR